VLASAFGAGAVLTITVLRALHGRSGYRRIGLRGLVLQAVTIAALAASPNLAIATAVLFLSGVGYFLALTSLTTLLQVEVPNNLRGRLMALWGVFFLGSRPLAAFVDSTVAAVFTVEVALLTIAAVVALSAVLIARATSSLEGLGPSHHGDAAAALAAPEASALSAGGARVKSRGTRADEGH
jgi:sugar phosphate permease